MTGTGKTALITGASAGGSASRLTPGTSTTGGTAGGTPLRRNRSVARWTPYGHGDCARPEPQVPPAPSRSWPERRTRPVRRGPDGPMGNKHPLT